jgi:hypothetical protein
MTDSQFQRQGASLVVSEKARVEELLERAGDLEHQLANSMKNKNSMSEEKAAELRTHLCEVLSDLIISDPVLALEHDGTGKLWRNCFYAPIGVWRKKLGREKRKQGPALKTLEHAFRKFLGEAMALYEYLVIQYQSKLVPGSSQENSQDISQATFDSSYSSGSTEGVVPGLCTFLQHCDGLFKICQTHTICCHCFKLKIVYLSRWGTFIDTPSRLERQNHII